MFANRVEAGRRLGEALEQLAWPAVVVLGVPRGGVVVGREVAMLLEAPLDIVVPRKVRAPHNPELGLGAVAPGVTFLDEDLIGALGVSEAYLQQETAIQQEEVERRSQAYRQGRPAVELAGCSAVVVDDGIATGGTAVAALRWARAREAARVALAVPVMPAAARFRMEANADEVVALLEPEAFYAVGQWYLDFDQVSDDEVVRTMAEEASRHPRSDGA